MPAQGPTDMMEPFLLRALLAGLGLGIVAAPLGCLVVWRRMSYFGETVAHAGLLGVALGLLLDMDLTLGVILVVAGDRRPAGADCSASSMLPVDSLLGILSHAALAAGLVAAASCRGPRLDLMGYLFGDIFAITNADLVWIYRRRGRGAGDRGMALAHLLAVAVHEELAAAEGLDTRRAEAALILILAFTIAIAMKIVGVLLIIAFLIMPAAAARPFADDAGGMVVLAAVFGVPARSAGFPVQRLGHRRAGRASCWSCRPSPAFR